MKLERSSIRILFYLLWFICLIIQANFTELIADEAYYWMYSKKLSWGYFDHPPIIALMIKAGCIIFNGELGVRFLSAIASTCMIFLWESIIRPKDIKLFYIIVLSIGALHLFGFIATPDSPFLLAATMFFFVYQKFIIKPNITIAVVLGVVISIMILSKYHGIILVGLTIISNYKVFKSRYFWLSFFTSLILLTPHLWWQVYSDYPSIKYHLFERSSLPYHISYTIEYLLTQAFILGPLFGIVFLIASWKFKSNNQFERTLKFIFWGGYIFFFLMTFKGRVEAHWTLLVIFPAVYISYKYLSKSDKKKRIAYYLFFISFPLILIARIIPLTNFKDPKSLLATTTKQFHNKDWALAINKQANQLPVAFMNSYQKASLYEFYSGSTGFSLNNIMGRKNQFDIWNVEDKYRGKKIMLIPNYEIKELDAIPDIQESYKYTIIDNFQSFSKIRIRTLDIRNEASASDTLKIKVTLENRKNDEIDFEVNKDYPSYISYHFFKGKELVKENNILKLSNGMLNKEIELRIVVPDKAGKYELSLCVRTGWLPPTINSDNHTIKVNPINISKISL